MKDNKVDKGSELIYWNLSYRRKFIRTLRTIPFCLVVLVFIWFLGGSIVFNTVSTIIIITMLVVQAIYTYSKWKREAQSS